MSLPDRINVTLRKPSRELDRRDRELLQQLAEEAKESSDGFVLPTGMDAINLSVRLQHLGYLEEREEESVTLYRLTEAGRCMAAVYG